MPGRARVRSCTGTGLLRARMQPVLAAFGVALALPDRHARLDLVDDVATGGEGGVAVRGGDADQDRDVADHQVAGAVHAARVEDISEARRVGKECVITCRSGCSPYN